MKPATIPNVYSPISKYNVSSKLILFDDPFFNHTRRENYDEELQHNLHQCPTQSKNKSRKVQHVNLMFTY